MLRLLEKLYRWLQNVGRAGDELNALKARVSVLESEIKRREAPEFCPLCATALRTAGADPIMRGDSQLGERRLIVCDACCYTKFVDVMNRD